MAIELFWRTQKEDMYVSAKSWLQSKLYVTPPTQTGQENWFVLIVFAYSSCSVSSGDNYDGGMDLAVQ